MEIAGPLTRWAAFLPREAQRSAQMDPQLDKALKEYRGSSDLREAKNSVDDRSLLRQGIAALVNAESDMNLVAERIRFRTEQNHRSPLIGSAVRPDLRRCDSRYGFRSPWRLG
jgi:hypothetical protein